MKPKTVTEIRQLLQRLEAKGYSDRILLVSNDEECNGFHELYGDCSDYGTDFTFYNQYTRKRETLPTIQIN